jgi:putative oxidoreductase
MTATSPLKFLHQTDVGVLLLRVGVGVAGIFHGAQKVFGVWEGHGIEGFAGALTKMNVPMPTVSAWLAALAELGGGALILVGLATRLASVPFAFTMLIAWTVAHKASFLKESGGSDFPFVLMLAALALVFTGAGKFSLDALLFKGKDSTRTV